MPQAAKPVRKGCPRRASARECVRDQGLRRRVPRISTSLPTLSVDKRGRARYSVAAVLAASATIQSRKSVIAGVSGFDFSDVSQ